MAKDRKNIFEQMSKFRNSSLTPGSFAMQNSAMGSQTRPTGARPSLNPQSFLPPQPEMGFAGFAAGKSLGDRFGDNRLFKGPGAPGYSGYSSYAEQQQARNRFIDWAQKNPELAYGEGRTGGLPMMSQVDYSPPQGDEWNQVDFTKEDYEDWLRGKVRRVISGEEGQGDSSKYDPNWRNNIPEPTVQSIPTSSGQMDRSSVIKARQRQAMIQQNALASMNQGMNSSFIREEDGEGNKSIYGNTGINANNPYFNSFG